MLRISARISTVLIIGWSGTVFSDAPLEKDTEARMRGALYARCAEVYRNPDELHMCRRAAIQAAIDASCQPFDNMPEGPSGAGNITIQSECVKQLKKRKKQIAREDTPTEKACVPMDIAVAKANSIRAQAGHYTPCEASIFLYNSKKAELRNCQRNQGTIFECPEEYIANLPLRISVDAGSIQRNCALDAPVCK